MEYDSYRVVETTRRTYRHAEVLNIHRDVAEFAVSANQAPEALRDEAWQQYVAMMEGSDEEIRDRDEVLQERTVSVLIPWESVEAMWP